MTEEAGKILKKADFAINGTMIVHVGRMEITVDFNTATIATTKDGEVVDKISYAKDYSLGDFGRHIDNVIKSESKLKGL